MRESVGSSLGRAFVRRVYADHNDSRAVQRALDLALSRISPGGWGLNYGAGSTRVHPRVINLDLRDGDHVDIRTSQFELPFRDNVLDVVVSQEVLEHVEDPAAVIAEVHRVLRPDGVFYMQLPFVIGYHPGPTDFWRFTVEGMRRLLAHQDWSIQELGRSVGHGTGFYRIAVEFAAVTASALATQLYRPAKAIAALAFSPLKMADRLTESSVERDRIPGGFFVLAQKVAD